MLATRRSVAASLVGICIVVMASGAGAQDDARAGELITVLAKQPANMPVQTWKEKRREAARKLGDLGDKKAVPALIKIVETEEFDIVGEFAITALGKLRDERAIPILQRVAGDRTRDRDQRKAAKKALAKLGTKPEPAKARPAEKQGAESSSPTTTILGKESSTEAPPGPQFDDDTLAAGELIRFALGGLSIDYDSIRDRPTINGDASGSYERRVDKKGSAWRYGGTASTTFGFVNFDGEDSSSRFGAVNARVNAEGRIYANGTAFYGGVLGSAGTSLTALRIFRPDGDHTYELYFGGELQLGLAAGYGRVLDIGEALRLRRLEKVLRDTKTLGRTITPDLAEKILATWWALRAELGAHKRLVVTVSMLREAGVLLGEPNASVTYKIMQVLLDGQLTHRLEGFDVSVGVIEGLIKRDDDLPVDDGREESAIVRARFGKQSRDGSRQLVGGAFGRYRILAGDEAAPWSVGVRSDLHAYFYGPNLDPIGAIEIGGEVGAANDDIADSKTGTRIAGSAGWRWTYNRASSMRVAGHAAFESGELFIGLTLDGVYGFLDAGYVGGSAVPAVIE